MKQVLQLRTRVDLTQRLQYLSLTEVTRAIRERNHFGDSTVKGKAIVQFLEEYNGRLVTQRGEGEDLKDDYLIAVGIYTYVAPLLNLSIPDKITQNFLKLLLKKPYQLEKPLNLYFRAASESDDNDPTFTEIDSDLLPVDKAFRQNNVESKIRGGLNEACQQLEKEHSTYDHFCFVGFNDICVPLFGVNLESERVSNLEYNLYTHNGSFLMKVPECFREE